MRMPLAWSVIFLVVLHVQLMACSLVNANLRQDILRKYDKNVRPVRNFSRPTEVRMDVSLRQILGLYWTDEYLSWDPDQYDELDVIRIPSGDIWLPDIFLYNNADVWQTGELATNTDVSVTSDGDVTWLQPITARTSCKVHTGLFPFDNQVCDLLLGSWSYDGTEIDLYNTSESGDISSFVVTASGTSSQLRLKESSTTTRVAPSLGPLALNVTVLLALTVFLMMVQESMPTSSGDVSVIGEIYTTAIAIVGLSTLATVLVINLSENDRPVPAWIARYFSDSPPKKVGDHGGSHGDHHAQAQSNGYDNEACGHVTHDSSFGVQII
ncbi:acetylcholine-gated cation-selective channel [Branchiostoma belcheri]|nr:acetylcholine-gated cation-selective channel [Branchiostoma belcheri]